MTRAELENELAVLLGGRAAEHIVFGHLSTGAADDLSKVTNIARSMVMRYGMDAKLGHVSYDAERQSYLGVAGALPAERTYSEETAREIDCAVRGIVDAAFDRTVQLLLDRRSLLERGAQELLRKETLSEQDLMALRSETVPA
jgi:cell division protease FtsH